MTVKDLRRLIANALDDTEVIVRTTEGDQYGTWHSYTKTGWFDLSSKTRLLEATKDQRLLDSINSSDVLIVCGR